MTERVTNSEIAADFDQVADLLEARGGDVHRIRAYRRGARTLRALPREVREIVRERGREGLVELPAIGRRLAGVIEERVATGRFGLLDRLLGTTGPEDLFTTVPGIGEELAARIHRDLGVESLEELELAAHDGRLENVPGIGDRRARAVREALDAMLRRSTRRRARLVGQRRATHAPAVGVLLAIDREYRRLAAKGRLRTIAPRRFNPQHENWLPVWHLRRGGWDFDVMFSNTARAHELGRTRDWVVVYYGRDGDDGQCTVVTEHEGELAGRRVVRGREHECLEALRGGESMPRRRRLATAAAVVLSLCGACRPHGDASTSKAPAVEDREAAPGGPYERHGRSIVRVETPSTIASGFVVDARGFVLTVYSAIHEETQARVVSAAGRTWVVTRVLAADPRTGIAVLAVDTSELRPLPLARNPETKAGDRVSTIGSGLGMMTPTLVDAVVTATQSDRGGVLALATSMPAGFAGAPVLDAGGRVVAVVRDDDPGTATPAADLVTLLHGVGPTSGETMEQFGVRTRSEAGHRGLWPNVDEGVLDECAASSRARVWTELARAVDLAAPLYQFGADEATFRILEGTVLRLARDVDDCAALIDVLVTAAEAAEGRTTPSDAVDLLGDVVNTVLDLLFASRAAIPGH